MGLPDISKHPVYPGFHARPMLEVSFNKAKWDSMPEDLLTILEVSVRDLARDMDAQLAMKDMEAVAKARAEGGVTIHNWSAEERNKFRKIATSQWEKVAARSENAQKAYDTLVKYLTEQGMI